MAYTKKEHFIGRRGMMRAIRYDMSEVGETTGKIWFRGPDTEHTIIMVWGKVLVTPTQGDAFELQVDATELISDMCDWPGGAEYEVKAIEAPVRFVAIFGPNAGLERYERLCPRCKAEQYQQPIAINLPSPRNEELHEGVDECLT
jgi:hypothetical protein